MVVIDTDVLLLAFAFHQDPRQADNGAFLQQVQAEGSAVAIYTLMELLGKLSFNLSADRLDQWPQWLVDAYQLHVIWPGASDTAVSHHSWREELFIRPFARMKTYKMPFMDALILNLAENVPGATCFVTWNARHFQNKSTLPVVTPTGYLGLDRL